MFNSDLAIKNNMEKFPERFSFILNNHGGNRYAPRVFKRTRRCVLLSTILKSKVAIQVSIRIMDAFVAMKKYISNDLMDYIKMLINHENRLSLIENTFYIYFIRVAKVIDIESFVCKYLIMISKVMKLETYKNRS